MMYEFQKSASSVIARVSRTLALHMWSLSRGMCDHDAEAKERENYNCSQKFQYKKLSINSQKATFWKQTEMRNTISQGTVFQSLTGISVSFNLLDTTAINTYICVTFWSGIIFQHSVYGISFSPCEQQHINDSFSIPFFWGYLGFQTA